MYPVVIFWIELHFSYVYDIATEKLHGHHHVLVDRYEISISFINVFLFTNVFSVLYHLKHVSGLIDE